MNFLLSFLATTVQEAGANGDYFRGAIATDMANMAIQDLRKTTHICYFEVFVNTIFGGFALMLRKS